VENQTWQRWKIHENPQFDDAIKSSIQTGTFSQPMELMTEGISLSLSASEIEETG
jgi:hypothetical protein